VSNQAAPLIGLAVADDGGPDAGLAMLSNCSMPMAGRARFTRLKPRRVRQANDAPEAAQEIFDRSSSLLSNLAAVNIEGLNADKRLARIEQPARA
jgi:hypothetical protein